MIYVAVNPIFAEKIGHDHPKKWQYNSTFENMELGALRDLAVWTYKGHPYCAQHAHIHHEYVDKFGKDKLTSYRVRENFSRCNIFSLDFDKGTQECSINELLLRPFFSLYAGYLYSTVSSTPERPRTRVIFQCDEVVEDVDRYHLLADALTWSFRDADQSCKDPIRIFAGSKLCDLRLRDRILPISILENYAYKYQEHIKAQLEDRRLALVKARETKDASRERVEELLRSIPSGKESLDYNSWMKIVAVIHDLFPGDVGIGLCEEWSSSRNTREIAGMFRSFDLRNGGKIATIDTLYWMARQRGWKGSRPFESEGERLNYALLRRYRSI